MKGWRTINLSGRKGQEEVSLSGPVSSTRKGSKERRERGGKKKRERKDERKEGQLTQGISNQRGTIMYV